MRRGRGPNLGPGAALGAARQGGASLIPRAKAFCTKRKGLGAAVESHVVAPSGGAERDDDTAQPFHPWLLRPNQLN